jgi:hypothetical protein
MELVHTFAATTCTPKALLRLICMYQEADRIGIRETDSMKALVRRCYEGTIKAMLRHYEGAVKAHLHVQRR